MKTTDEIINKIDWISDHLHTDDINEIKQYMGEYAREVIDYILSHPELIHVSEEDDMPTEALYNYEAFDELKKSL